MGGSTSCYTAVQYILHCGTIMVADVRIPVWYFPQYDCLVISINWDLEKLNLPRLINKFSDTCRSQRRAVLFTWNSNIHCHISIELKLHYHVYIESKDSLSSFHDLCQYPFSVKVKSNPQLIYLWSILILLPQYTGSAKKMYTQFNERKHYVV